MKKSFVIVVFVLCGYVASAFSQQVVDNIKLNKCIRNYLRQGQEPGNPTGGSAQEEPNTGNPTGGSAQEEPNSEASPTPGQTPGDTASTKPNATTTTITTPAQSPSTSPTSTTTTQPPSSTTIATQSSTAKTTSTPPPTQIPSTTLQSGVEPTNSSSILCCYIENYYGSNKSLSEIYKSLKNDVQRIHLRSDMPASMRDFRPQALRQLDKCNNITAHNVCLFASCLEIYDYSDEITTEITPVPEKPWWQWWYDFFTKPWLRKRRSYLQKSFMYILPPS